MSESVSERIRTFVASLEALGRMPTKPEIRFLGDMERLQIGPDDCFVLTADRALSDEMHGRIQAAWANFAGDRVKLLVLDKGMKLGAINVVVTPDCDNPGA